MKKKIKNAFLFSSATTRNIGEEEATLSGGAPRRRGGGRRRKRREKSSSFGNGEVEKLGPPTKSWTGLVLLHHVRMCVCVSHVISKLNRGTIGGSFQR